MRNSQTRAFAAISLFVLSTSFVNAGQSACKGLVENVCSAANACAWVSGYERKNGVKINGYCRNKAKKASAGKAMPEPRKSADVRNAASDQRRS